ncbi:MAG TPA: transcription antitermination factor NusB [Casimicrobiaceae bacterium]|nr:transcription antitermination factor NusB [Casimicrobiaceae bacterium]
MSRVSPRRRARELALQGLYEHRLGGAAPATIGGEFADSPHFTDADQAFLAALWRGLHTEPDRLVDALRPFLDRSAEEVSPIERSILLIGAWELLHQPETPYRVVINEAVELAKSYGGTDGHRFVNGVLDKLAARVRAPEIEAAARERRGGKPA